MRKSQFDRSTFLLLFLLTIGALLVAGYHPAAEDAEIYVPGILKVLHPRLFPYNQGFFAEHAHMTLFPEAVAESVRLSHLSLNYALLVWQLLAIFLLLYACWRISRLCFTRQSGIWGGVALVAALLTIPVANTALYILDQYLNTRSLSTPMILLAIVNVVEHKWLRAAAWIALTAVIHPLMVVFGAAYMFFVIWMEHRQAAAAVAMAAMLFPWGFFPPVTPAYRQILVTREYFFLLQWRWYEWLGIIAPLLLLWWFGRLARRHSQPVRQRLCSALILFELLFFAAALVITIPPQLANLAELQPMRALHLVYIFLFVIGGGLLGEWVLRDRVWRWLVLFVPLCMGMSYAQLQLFPASPHLEMPWTKNNNQWVQTFLWIRNNTPIDAYFALDPRHMALPGEDQEGFRALARRSMLADDIKDSGAASMFPQLAPEWQRQVEAEQGWNSFQVKDFERLKDEFGVNWVVLEHPVAGLPSVYRNGNLQVCRIP